MPQEPSKILVTGGAGFIGGAVCRHLIASGASVINFDKLTYAACPASLAEIEGSNRYAFVHGDVADRGAVRAAFEAHQPDAVMHLAAESHVDRSIESAEPFVQTNIVGTYVMLEEAARHWRGMAAGKAEAFRFLHISTDEVYGSLGEEGLFTETTPYDPRSPYSASKASADHLVSAWGHTYGLPVYRLFGGPVRERIPLYWSHCGSFRATLPELFAQHIGGPVVRDLAGITELGREVKRRGYRALKTNPMLFDGERPRMTNPGFRPGLDLGRNGDPQLFDQIVKLLQAFREGAGPDVGLLLDVNFGFTPEALRQLAYRLEPLGLVWLEADMHAPEALAWVRGQVKTPIASLESIYRVKGYLPYLNAQACDVAIIDIVWNGLPESLKIAQAAEAREVNVAPHNFYGHIASLIGAHFAAIVPNLRIMEYEADDVPWQDEYVTHPPVVENGDLLLPTGPGWGADVVEAAVRRRPPR